MVKPGIVVQQTIRNSKEDTGNIRIIKQDEDGKKLSGAQFRIERIDDSGNVLNTVGTFETVSGEVTISDLRLGTYRITETKAPDGYVLDSTPIIKTLSTNGVTVDVVITNEKVPLDFTIAKLEEGTETRIQGAKFKFKNASNQWLGENNVLTTESSAKEFVTDANGEIKLTSIPNSTWYAIETYAPQGYKIIDAGEIELTPNNTTKVYNKKIIDLEIKKVDSKNANIVLSGAKFIFKNTTKGTWLYKDAAGEYQLTSDQSKALVVTTDSNGLITLQGVPAGEYEATETQAPTGYEISSGTVKLSSNQTTVVTNIKLTNLEIRKVDELNTSVNLANAKFTVKNKTEGKWLAKNSQGEYVLVDSEANATVFVTDSQGKITITGVVDGEWEAYEKEAPAGYELLTEPSTLQNNQTTIIANHKPYVTIEGVVFEDGHQGKTSTLNNVYDAGEGVNGVRIILKRNGQEISNVSSGYASDGTKCATDGQYRFVGNQLKIERDHLSEYTIEFVYNGMEYQSIAVTSTLAGNGSKAKESASDRQAFNTKYSTVTADTKISNGQSTNKASGGDIIRYKSQNYTSEIIYSTNAKDDNGKPYDATLYADDQYHITASTTEAGLDLGSPNKEGGYPYDPTKDTIVDVNFGIYEREHPDIAITSDLVAAETSINGYSQVYQYQKRYDQIDDGSAYTVQVKASDATYNQTYERKLYKSDVEYAASTNDGSELAIYLTYRISIKNQSSSINVTVNDIVNYFSKDFSDGIIAVGTGATVYEIDSMGNNRTFAISNTDGIKVSGVSEDSGYSKQYITLNKEIGVGSGYQFFIQFEMKKEAIIKTLQGEITFENIAELNTCSAKHQNGQTWTAVDSDSAVGNCVPSNKATLEDDTDYAPSIKILVDEINERTINGIVFEDSTSSDLKTNEVRNGNGTYETGEKGVENVTVQLIDLDRGTIAYSNNGGTNVKSTTNGNYAVHGFIPGNYIIKYTYGDGSEEYTAQQYKSTIYVDKTRAEDYYGNGYHNGTTTGNAYWYLEDVNSRKSDAIDNYNGEMTTMYNISESLVNKTRTEIEDLWKQADGVQHILNSTNIDKTLKIDAYTPYLAMPVEKAGTQGGAYIISNVDFGIAERARYKVKLEKVINRIQIIRADGSYLRDFTDFDNPPANTKAIRSQRGMSRGFVQFEIDTELLQTTTLLVEYGFRAENISEVEYVTEDYYKYGIIPADKENTVVRLSIANIIDYVDNELQYADSNHMISDGNTSNTNQANSWATIDLSKNENKKYVSQDVLDALYQGGKCEYSTILISDGLDNAAMLAPGQGTNTIRLSLSKTLAPTQDEMKYENLVEVVEVKKTWGRELSMEESTAGAGDGQKLGDLDPTDPENDTKVVQVKDPDSHYSETIIINPPTGANKNITIYTILGITCFVILAGGIVLIKKKVL